MGRAERDSGAAECHFIKGVYALFAEGETVIQPRLPPPVFLYRPILAFFSCHWHNGDRKKSFLRRNEIDAYV